VLSIKLVGAEALSKKLQPKTITGPLNDGVKKITLELLRLTKMATVVRFGRLRSSIVSETTNEFSRVYTDVEYAPFVEYGHFSRAGSFIEARHMESGRKVLGEGMFTYALRRLNEKLGDYMKKIGVNIERKFEEA